MRKLAAFLFTLWITLISAYAQIFEYIGIEEGLSSRRVLSIQQDLQGYIWILTHKGIDRYNGKQFTHYPIYNKNKAVSFYPNLNTLKVDEEQTLWEIGKDGLAFCFDKTSDEFQLVFNLKTSFPKTKKEPVTATFMDQERNIWFCIKDHQYIFNGKSKLSYKVSPSIPGKIICITQTPDNILYIATEQHLYSARLENQSLKELKTIDLPSIQLINYIYYHAPTKKLVINTLLDNLFIYDPQSHELSNTGNAMIDIGVNAIIQSKKNPDEVLIATDGDGVYKLNISQKKLMHFLQEDSKHPNKMNGSIIKDIYIDQSERIWNVIYPTGITIYSEKYPSYTWIKHSPNYSNSLINNAVNGIIEDADGDIWYATSNGVSCYNVQKKKWINYLSSFSQSTQNENHIFIALCDIGNGKILAGGYMSGIYLINKHTGKITFHQQEALTRNETPDKYIRSIFRDNDGIIWTGGFYSLKSYNPKTKAQKTFTINYPINHISQRDNLSLWIGTIHGMYLFDKAKNELLPYKTDINFGCINTVYTQAKEKQTYIGTYGNGLFIIDNQTEKITNYHADNSGLQTNNICSILPNRNGNLYLGTENGLSLLNIKNHFFTNWTKEQGLLAANFNPNAAIHSQGGELIFGSNEGIILLPDSIELPHEFNSRMVLSDLSIMYHKVHPGEKNSPLTQQLDETSSFKLNYNQNTFSLNVSSINYDNPSSILYSWKLEGFYNEWTPPTDNGLIRYTNLSPGEYTLRIRSILLDNHQVLEERTIKIEVGRPFWLTFWAFIIYTVIIIGAIYTWFRYQMIKRERQASKEKINFFTSAAHDIRTPLTLIKAPLAEVIKNEQLTEQGTINLNLAIQNAENLSELADNLLNFQKEELYSSRVSVSQQELNSYLHSYLKRFDDYAKSLDIQLEYKSSFENLQVWIDTNKMDSIIRNLLSNALKYTPKGGRVTMEVWAAKNYWHMNISDTGIGISKEDQKKLFKYMFRGYNATNQLITGCGVGMLLTYRLIKNHEGKITCTSTENVGTTFQLSFPIHSKNYSYKPVPNQNKETSIPAQVKPEVTFPTSEATPASSPADAPLILIVDDNNALRSFITHSLSATYRVEGANNGKEALALIAQQQPDLILSDVMMPVMDGKELCSQIKGNMETSHIPVILLTALGDKENMLEGLETKADQYIVKPFDLMVLEANIRTILENRNLIRQRFRQAITHLPDAPISTEVELPSTLDDEFMQRVTELVKQGLGKDLTVDTLCASVNMSRTSFYNKIKALTGIAPNDFIRNIRMQEAALLLKSHRYTVSEVADRMGFADPKYFTDTFKKFYGVPPSIYMKQEKEK